MALLIETRASCTEEGPFVDFTTLLDPFRPVPVDKVIGDAVLPNLWIRGGILLVSSQISQDILVGARLVDACASFGLFLFVRGVGTRIIDRLWQGLLFYQGFVNGYLSSVKICDLKRRDSLIITIGFDVGGSWFPWFSFHYYNFHSYYRSWLYASYFVCIVRLYRIIWISYTRSVISGITESRRVLGETFSQSYASLFGNDLSCLIFSLNLRLFIYILLRE